MPRLHVVEIETASVVLARFHSANPVSYPSVKTLDLGKGWGGIGQTISTRKIRLRTLAKRYPSTVIMIDLASAQRH